MPFVLPVFNLACRAWHQALPVPPANGPPAAPDVVFMGNLSPGRLIATIGFNVQNLAANLPQGWLLSVLLRVPAMTDLRSYAQSDLGDLVEVPSGSARWYRVFQIEDIGKGFSNEHRLAYLSPNARTDSFPWAVPYA